MNTLVSNIDDLPAGVIPQFSTGANVDGNLNVIGVMDATGVPIPHGQKAVHKITTTSGQDGYPYWGPGRWSPSGVGSSAGTTIYGRIYIYLPSYPPSGSVGFFGIDTNSFTARADVRVSSTGKLQVFIAGVQAGTASTNLIPTGQWVRIETLIQLGTGGTGQMQWRMYSGDALTPIESKTVSGVSIATGSGSVFAGAMGPTSTTTYWLADVAASDGGWVGPQAMRWQPTVTTTALTTTVQWDALTAEDVTDDIRGPVSASYGRDQATSLSPVVAGRGEFDLDNSDRRYSPRNVSSPLYGKLKPSRPVVVTRVVAGTTFTIFSGHTDDSPINPDLDSRRVTLSLIDFLADFRGVQITTGLYQGIRTGDAISAVLDAVGWTRGRDLDTGATTIPWFWANGDDAFDLLQQILASEGPPALLTVDNTGGIVFRDRHHRLVRAASITPQATFSGGEGDPEPAMARGFTYSDNWANIVNTVSFTVNERAPTRRLVQVWQSDDTVSLGPSAAHTVVISTTDPFFGAIAPEAGTDFDVTTGSVATVTLSRTSGASTSITFTAGASGASITGLALRATSVPVARSRVVTASDSTSQADYGQRSLPSGQEPVWASYPDAQSIADLCVLMRKDPLPMVQARFVAQHQQTARLLAILGRDLSDRVHVVEPETALADDFFIESISHDMADVTDHAVTFGLEMVPTAPASAFILDTSTLGGPNPLGY